MNNINSQKKVFPVGKIVKKTV